MITCDVRPVREISTPEVDELYTLFQTAFSASRRGFDGDLGEKDYLLRVRTEQGLSAFSTLKIYYPEPGVRLLYSGDTLSREGCGHHLPARWAQFVYRELPHQPGLEDYWLLLCSGYRTYRILPTFFQTYIPSEQGPPCLLQQRERWAGLLFGERYRDGVVHPQWPTPLHSPEPPSRLAEDPHVRLFQQLNPGYREGQELACLVPLDPANLRPSGRRLATAALL